MVSVAVSVRFANAAGRATAGAVLEKGLAALEQKDLPTADKLLTDAYRQSPRTEVLFHLARLAEAEGRTLAAHDLYRRYLADPARDPDEAATRAAEQFVKSPPPLSGMLSVQSDPGALVFCDGHIVGSLPLPLPILVEPGAHTVVLEFSNKRLEAPAQVAAGRFVEVQLSRGSGVVVVSVIPAILHIAQRSGTGSNDSRVLSEAMEQSARGEQHTLLGAELAQSQSQSQSQSQGVELRSCLKEESCQRQLATKNQSKLLLIERTVLQGTSKQPSWSIELSLLRVDVAAPAATTTVRCEGCAAVGVALRLKDAMNHLLAEGISRQRGTLKLVTQPASASVRIDDAPAVSTPHQALLWTGEHTLHISRSGYRDAQRTIEVTNGSTVEVNVELEQNPDAQIKRNERSERTGRPKWRLALGGALIGAGLVMGGIGLGGVLSDGQCLTQPEVAGGACQNLNDTLVPGGVALGSGIFVIGSGILLLALPGSRR